MEVERRTLDPRVRRMREHLGTITQLRQPGILSPPPVGQLLQFFAICRRCAQLRLLVECNLNLHCSSSMKLNQSFIHTTESLITPTEWVPTTLLPSEDYATSKTPRVRHIFMVQKK